MPKFKTVNLVAENSAGVSDKLSVTVNVDSDGWFYATLPNHLAESVQDANVIWSNKGILKARAKSFETLVSAIKQAHQSYLTPEITEEPVIRYNIESHVSFAMDDAGNIFPNAGFPGAKWPKHGRESTGPDYGNHHAVAPCNGGYSLTIGARAMLKTTHRYGSNSKVTYSWYRAGGSHHDHDNPANLLNSWCSIDLGKNPKEIPYTDEAAMFFHRLLLGMAEMSRRVQEMTFTQDKLLALIDQSSSIRLLTMGAKGD